MPVSPGCISYTTYRTLVFFVTLVKFISVIPTIARFPHQYDAYELNQCKLKLEIINFG